MDTSSQENNSPSMFDDEAQNVIEGFSTHDGERVEAAKKDEPVKKGWKRPDVLKDLFDEEGFDQNEDEDEDDQAQDPDSDETDARVKQHRSAKKRIGKAVKGQREAERERDAAIARLTALEARLANLETGGGEKTPKGGEDAAPDPQDYDAGTIDPGYLAAVAAHSARKTMDEVGRKQKEAAEKSQQEQSQQAQQKAYSEAIDKFKQLGADRGYDDFEEVVFDEDNIISQTMGQLMLDCDEGADIAYMLASDYDLAKKVSKLTPSKQAIWFGRQAAKISSQSSDAGGETVVQSTKAPKPPRRKANGVGRNKAVAPSTTDFAAFERLSNGAK